jgi:hypothetical protein
MNAPVSPPMEVQAAPSGWWGFGFVASAALASASLTLSFWMADAPIEALIAATIGLLWTAPFLFGLGGRRRKSGSQPSMTSPSAIGSSAGIWFIALVVLAAWSVVNGGLFYLCLFSAAFALVAWDIYSYLERAALHAGVGGAPERIHLRALGLALGGGLAAAGVGYGAGRWMHLTHTLWLEAAIGLVLVFILIRIARNLL